LQEQEQRIAIEAEEKRLKAALTAKREPNASASRLASPAIGNTANSEVVEAKPLIEDSETSMAIDSGAQSRKEEVGVVCERRCSENSQLFLESMDPATGSLVRGREKDCPRQCIRGYRVSRTY
jgi:hypothetical protein